MPNSCMHCFDVGGALGLAVAARVAAPPEAEDSDRVRAAAAAVATEQSTTVLRVLRAPRRRRAVPFSGSAFVGRRSIFVRSVMCLGVMAPLCCCGVPGASPGGRIRTSAGRQRSSRPISASRTRRRRRPSIPSTHGNCARLDKRTRALVRRYPLAADTLLALALAAAALVSLAATYDELPATDTTFSHGFTLAVVASMLALTLPLALRRRFPFSVAVVVVVAFLVARIVVHVPEANVSLLAAWLMIYSVAVHGERRFRTPVLLFATSPLWPSSYAKFSLPAMRTGRRWRVSSTSSTTCSWSPCRGCSGLPYGRCAIVNASWPIRPSNSESSARRTPVKQCSPNGSGSLASCTMSWPTT